MHPIDEFAKEAMGRFLDCYSRDELTRLGEEYRATIAMESYLLAEAMIKERDRKANFQMSQVLACISQSILHHSDMALR